jgi:predicted nucleic acid-binding Zn ribbon protein
MAAAGMEAATQQRRRVRRSALLWALIAAAFYLGFIIMALLRGAK